MAKKARRETAAEREARNDEVHAVIARMASGRTKQQIVLPLTTLTEREARDCWEAVMLALESEKDELDRPTAARFRKLEKKFRGMLK